HKPSDVELIARAVIAKTQRPMQWAGLIPKTIGAVARFALAARRVDAGMPAPLRAPRTSFNVAITPHRKTAFTHLSLDEVKEVKRAFGTTVNDVVLAICAGALRKYLDARNELPDRSLIAV